MRRSIMLTLWLAAAVLIPRPAAASAESAEMPGSTVPAPHTLGQSYMALRVYDDSLVVRLEVGVGDLERALALGWNAEAGVPRDQVAAALDRVRRYVEAGFSISSTSGPLERTFRSFDLFFLEVSEYVLLTYTVRPFDRTVEDLTISFPLLHEIDPDHRNLVVIEHNWRTGTFESEGVALIFGPTNQVQTLDLTESSVWRGFRAFIRLGIEHIWGGIDHIMFLLALTLPSVLVRTERRWEPVEDFHRALINMVKIVTFFTLAHTITLSLAALEIVRVPSRPVEAVIALSIAVAALLNLMPWIRIPEPAIAFGFGLFHGLGFAYVLGEIGLEHEYLVPSLLGFNMGVEIGQVAIILVLFPVLFLLRQRGVYRHLFRWVSAALIAVALLWFFERALGFNLPLIPIARQILGLA